MKIWVPCAGLVALLVVPQQAAAEWSSLGSGIEGGPWGGDPAVYSLATYDGALVASGYFTTAGGAVVNGIARWDGSAWTPLGTGLEAAQGHALAVYEGELVVGGAFTSADGVPAGHIAKWNGISWSSLGSGVNDGVVALTTYNGALIAGGYFGYVGSGIQANGIAEWDGTSWSPLGSGMTGFGGRVYCLCIYNGGLIAGGNFSAAGGVSANYIARWDGTSWSPLGSGMNSDGSTGQGVSTLIVYDGQLIAGGTFTTAGGVPANGIARWDGTSWSALGSGLGYAVTSLATYNTELFAGGLFNEGAPSAYIARWNGSSWDDSWATGLDYWVYSLAPYHGSLVVGGSFTRAGGLPANSVAVWQEGLPERGACCFPSPEWSCQIHTPSNCDLYSGIYLGDRTVCDPNPCLELIGVDEGSPVVPQLRLATAPNPSSGDVLILCLLPVPDLTTVRLFDTVGRLVRRLHEGDLPAGETRLRWDGRDDSGRHVPAGVYMVKAMTLKAEASERVILTR